ncbi:MAG: metallophosphoesterase [Acidobacteriota bacterium]|nr:metallophosphoesterase [Acidobacteriota bacterium]MDH3785792.1 metallophosphoesterase [Acidobacteriota bacterium]
MTRRVVLLLLLVLVWWSAAVVADEPDCDRVFAIGDIHGGVDAHISILQEIGLIDSDRNWTGGQSCLVQTGDYVDRGERSREVLDLLMKLEEQAAGRLVVLLGNHEIMNIVGDLRYVREGEFTAFAAEETTAERDAGFQSFRTLPAVQRLAEKEQRAKFESDFPAGWFAHRRAFSPEGRYGAWLSSKRLVAQILDSVFLHGGLSLRDATTGVDALNENMRRDLRRYLDLRKQLAAGGIVHALVPYGDAWKTASAWLESASSRGAARKELVEGFLSLREAAIFRGDGPVWDRRLALEAQGAYEETVTKILDAVGAKRIVVGHSVTPDGLIDGRFSDRVFAIDTGAGPAYDGQVSTLEITPQGGTRAIYIGRATTMSRPDQGWLEQALLNGDVVESRPIGVGVTGANKLRLEWDGVSLSAAQKTVEIEERGIKKFSDKVEFNFTDSYRYERAAYVLDQLLGMNMVPVAVHRKIGTDEGAVIEWIEDCITEEHRIAHDLKPEDPSLITQGESMLNLFDALIFNTDRNRGNLLWTHDWELYLIDHSRAFRQSKKLPKTFMDVTVWLPRRVHERLKNLSDETLLTELDGLLDRTRIKAIMKRRDLILAKIESDRKRFGDKNVYIP